VSFTNRAPLTGPTARNGRSSKAFVIFANDHEIDMFWLFILKRAEALIVELHRAEIDVLFEFKAGPEENAFFQDTRFYIRVTDCAKQDSRELP